MSLSLLERLTLLIHPRRLVLERRGWRAKARRDVLAVELPAAGEADWQPALAGAENLLRAAKCRGAALEAVIADPFVRYALLPWSDTLSSDKSRRAMAHALLRHALGERVDTLDIAVDRPAFGRGGIAAGVDRQLLAGLRLLAKGQGLRLTCMQPRLAVELAAHGKQLDDGWLACIDEGWLTLLGLRRGEMVSLRNHRATDGDAAQLAGLLTAEAAVVDGRKVFVCATGGRRPVLGVDWEAVNLMPVISGAEHA